MSGGSVQVGNRSFEVVVLQGQFPAEQQSGRITWAQFECGVASLAGRFSFTGVVLAGTFGSYLGAAATYWAARWLGRPLMVTYGYLVFCPEDKLLRAERWLARYEAGGIFFARLVPVVRHLIGIPAGIVRMPFGLYSAMTIAGAGLWCWILAWFGGNLLGDQPELINDPSLLVQVLRQRSWLFGGFALLLCALYVLVMRLTAKPASSKA